MEKKGGFIPLGTFGSVWKYFFVAINVDADAAAAAKSLQSCLTLRDPMDRSPPGSSVHGTFQARTLEWVPLPSLDVDATGI